MEPMGKLQNPLDLASIYQFSPQRLDSAVYRRGRRDSEGRIRIPQTMEGSQAGTLNRKP